MSLREAAQQALDVMEDTQWAVADQAPNEDVAAHDKAMNTLRAALAKEQDWDEIEALRASLREHMYKIQRLREAGRQAFDELKEYKRSDDDRVSIAMHILNAALAENSWLDEQLDTLFEEIDKGEFKAAQNRIDELSNTEKYGHIHIPELSEAQALIGRYSRFEQTDKSMQRLTEEEMRDVIGELIPVLLARGMI